MHKSLQSYTPDFVSAYAKLNNCYCLYLSLQTEADFKDVAYIRRAAPYLTVGDCADLVLHGWLVIECKSLRAMNRLFEQTVGDDPACLNKYNGKFRIYALTIGPNGPLTENT